MKKSYQYPVICLLAIAQTISAAASNEKPTAYVFEYADQWTRSSGAAGQLAHAGFEVAELPLDRSPLEMTVDLIFLGSFVSENPAYREYMKKYAADLYHYVEKGRLLVQMVQADQTEKSPPFLPSTLAARRADPDYAKAHILTPKSHLLQSLSFPNNTFQFHQRVTIWEAFVDQAGFEVIVAGDPDAQSPALMEGACGRGRIILSSLALDKTSFGTFGDPDSAIKPIRAAFFRNLAAHALNVRLRQTKPLTITPSPQAVLDYVEGSWTFVLLPDTQHYSRTYPGVFLAQTAWIAQNHDRYRIAYVFQLGDITNNNTIGEWENARMALSLMDGKVPYAFCPGNHDYGPNGVASSRETRMNEFLSYDHYQSWPTFGGAMTPGKMDNTYHLFQAGGYNWIALALEWAPQDETIAWANQIMARYPDRLGIMFTHAYLNNNDLRYDHTDKVNPQRYNPYESRTPGSLNDGQELWDKLVRKHNFVFVFNGHVLGDGAGYRADVNDLGRTVHQMLANYQMRTLGGEAYLRRLEFLPDGKTVQVKTYSPLYDKYLLTPDQQFPLKVDLTAYARPISTESQPAIPILKSDQTLIQLKNANPDSLGLSLFGDLASGSYMYPVKEEIKKFPPQAEIVKTFHLPMQVGQYFVNYALKDQNAYQTILEDDSPYFNTGMTYSQYLKSRYTTEPVDGIVSVCVIKKEDKEMVVIDAITMKISPMIRSCPTPSCRPQPRPIQHRFQSRNTSR